MNTVCLYTQNSRLSQRWKNLLSVDNEVLLCTEFDLLKKLVGEGVFVVFHDERDTQIIVKELDLLHEVFEKKNTFVLRSQPDLAEGEIFLSHDIGGYGNANMSDDVFLQAIKVIQSGNVWLYPDLMTKIISKINKINDDSKIHQLLKDLTDREKEVALLVSKGDTNKMIADELGISQNTVKLHVSSIFEKLSIKSRVALAILFSRAS